MKRLRWILLLVASLQGLLLGQQATIQTYLGYAYPSGGQRGESFRVLLGGRYLKAPEAVIVSGAGVSVEILQHYPALQKINGTRQKMLKMQIAERESELSGKPVPAKLVKTVEKLTDAEKERDAIPKHEVFDRIGEMDTIELNELKEYLKEYNARQYNGQIAERVALQVTIAPNAALGNREMRIVSKAGLSNPITFQISQSKECLEREPNDATSSYSFTSIIESFPSVMNGQVMPGDVDRYLFRAQAGQQVFFDLMARRLIPYVADAVPGWFQATLTLYDGEGKRVAYVDDTYGDPDPSLSYTFTEPGNYIVEVRDAIYRGRENFVYRLFMSDAKLKENRIRQIDVDYGEQDLPFSVEREPNNTASTAALSSLPVIQVGRIGKPLDLDMYAFEGQAGERVIAQVEARTFDSPMDSLIRLYGPDGTVLAMNDDYTQKQAHLHMGPGLMTHYADSYLTYELPEAGRYMISVEDVQRKGGTDYQYRLRLSRPIADFEVRATPSSLNVGATGCVELHLYVNRIDGYDGPIQLELVDPPEGVRLDHALIPAGQNDVRATLQWTTGKRYNVSALQFKAVGTSNGQVIERGVVPADNSMQAFLWRHLLPAQELQVMALTNYKSFIFEPNDEGPALELSKEGKAKYEIHLVRGSKNMDRFKFRLKEAPEGVELLNGKLEAKRIRLEFKCSEALVTDRTEGNLILEVLENRKNSKVKWVPVGVLPAVPYTMGNL